MRTFFVTSLMLFSLTASAAGLGKNVQSCYYELVLSTPTDLMVNRYQDFKFDIPKQTATDLLPLSVQWYPSRDNSRIDLPNYSRRHFQRLAGVNVIVGDDNNINLGALTKDTGQLPAPQDYAVTVRILWAFNAKHSPVAACGSSNTPARLRNYKLVLVSAP
jgi:hypothetical protein